jgi:hypothetical protein
MPAGKAAGSMTGSATLATSADSLLHAANGNINKSIISFFT